VVIGEGADNGCEDGKARGGKGVGEIDEARIVDPEMVNAVDDDDAGRVRDADGKVEASGDGGGAGGPGNCDGGFGDWTSEETKKRARGVGIGEVSEDGIGAEVEATEVGQD
jgi:hypothetical protein